MAINEYEPYRLPEIEDTAERAEALEMQLSEREADDYTTLVSAAVEGSSPIRGTDPIARVTT